MTEFWQEERFRRLVSRQHGRITRAQLIALGVPNSTVGGWTKSGYLTRVLPKVYAVGHTAPSKEADLWAAVLYAGPGAELSHTSGAHHRGLIIYPPDVIHVSTPRVKIKSIPEVVKVHAGRNNLEPSSHEGIPTTTVAQTLLDLAGDPGHYKLLRRALAVLDYRDELDIRAIERICGKGRAGSKALKEALATHQPELAHANGELEEAFLYLCEGFNIPIPRFNRSICGFPVDAYWPEHNLVVEVDGLRNHSKPAQLRTDRRKELTLRAHGLQVVRYDWPLVTGAPEEVGADLLRQLAAASPTR
jgi:very-short-patch-repair endonuclease